MAELGNCFQNVMRMTLGVIGKDWMESVFQKLLTQWKPRLPRVLCTVRLPAPLSPPAPQIIAVLPMPVPAAQCKAETGVQKAKQTGFVLPPVSWGPFPGTCSEL